MALRTPPFVDEAWLQTHPEAVLADVRYYLDGRSGRDAHAAGHLPGAVFVDMDTVLAAHGTPAEGRHPLPTPEAFAAGLAACGIGSDDVVVGYDDGTATAARLVWLLRVTGHEAALLDGGTAAVDSGLEVGEVRRPAADFAPVPWPEQALAGIDEVAGTDETGGVLLDARDGARYRGEHEPVDPVAGHVPGARSLPWRETVDERGRLLPRDVLRGRLQEAGVGPGTPVVSSCGSGVTACHTLLVLEHVGLPPGRLYAGSWSQWSASGRPVATGPEPGSRSA
jgi:thiosulfate/3-mercaptopyruvate sulfurtransferase